MSEKTHKGMLVGGVVATLFLLPGCMNNSKTIQEETINVEIEEAPLTGEVLVSMKGKAVITTDSMADEKERFLNWYPQFRQVLPVMDPKEVDHLILEQVITQKIIDEYIAENKIDQTESYKKDLAAAIENIVRMLNAKHFGENLVVSVSDAEIKEFYEANKDSMPGIIVSQGGISTTGIEFSDESTARAFMTKAKSVPGGFKKAAQDEGLTAQIKDFKLVNAQSIGVDAQLRDKIVGIKTVPAIELFAVDGKFWVVNATSKEEPKYRPYDQLKDRLKQQVEQNKKMELLQEKLNKLREQFKIEINEDYFKPGDMMEEEEEAMPTKSGGIAQVNEKEDEIEKRLA